MEDREIAERLRSGDERGMEALLGQYGPLLRYVVRPILPREEDREDCLSEISLRIWARIGGYTEDRGTLVAWLTAIARNTALSHAQREGPRTPEALSHQTADPAPSPEEETLRREEGLRLRQLLHSLEEPYREVFLWRHYGDLSFREIGQLFGKSENWACVTYHRARGKLRKEWEALP